MPDEHRRRRGLLQGLLAVLCLSITPTLVKVGLVAAVDPVTLLALRLLAAVVIYWILFALFWRKFLRIDRRALLACVAVAAANATSMLMYYHALARIDVSVAHMIFAIFPLATLLLLAAWGERIRRLSLVRLGLALSGVYLLVGPGGEVDALGVALLLLTSVPYALHLALSQWYLSEVPYETVAIYVVTIMAAMVGAVGLVRFEYWQPLSPVGWGVVLSTGLVSTVFARLAMFGAIQKIGSAQTALLGPAETLLAVTWANLFLGERLSSLQWLGGFLILGSAALAARDRPPAVVIRGRVQPPASPTGK